MKKRIWIPQTIASLMLLWALAPSNPYSYYILLRWVCFGVFGFLAYHAHRHKSFGWVWTLGLTAAVYNPVFRVHLAHGVWSLVNVATIALAIVSIFKLPIRGRQS